MDTNAAFLRQPAPAGPSRPRYDTRGPRPHVRTGPVRGDLRVGAILREARKRKGLTLAEVRDAGIVVPSVLSRWERGFDPIPAKTLDALAAFYGLDASLVREDTTEAVISAEEHRLLAAYRLMPEADRRAVRSFITGAPV